MKGCVYYITFKNPKNDELVNIEWKNMNDAIEILQNKIKFFYPNLNIKITKNTIYNMTKKNNKSINKLFSEILNLEIKKESKKNLNSYMLGILNQTESSSDDEPYI